MYETSLQADLIFDVGMHKGEDTAYYLKKGFRVIGFEADPELVEHCRQKFTSEIACRKLVIVEGAIVAPDPNGHLPEQTEFFKNSDHSVWGTAIPSWAERNTKLGSESTIISVPVVDFSQCLRDHGIPYYLKIDIEGMDSVCLELLKDFEQKPNYLSIEAQKSDFTRLRDELSLFKQLGYVKFKAIQQSGISLQKEPNPSLEGEHLNYKFKEGSSGTFGEDLTGKWKSTNQITKLYRFIFWQYKLFGDDAVLSKISIGKLLIKVLSKITGKPIPGWYDTHAKHSRVKR